MRDTDCDQIGDGYIYWDGNMGVTDLKDDTVAYLGVWLYTDGEPASTPVFFSHHLNMTEAASSSSFSHSNTQTATSEAQSLVTASTTSGILTTIASMGVTETTPPATSTASHKCLCNPSTAVAIVAGVGGGIGGAIILVAVAVAVCKFGRRGAKEKQLPPPAYPGQDLSITTAAYGTGVFNGHSSLNPSTKQKPENEGDQYRFPAAQHTSRDLVDT